MNRKALVYFKVDSLDQSLAYGDLIIISGALQSIAGPQNPQMFNYRQYLNNRQIYGQIFLEPGHWQATGKVDCNPVKSLAEKCREKCLVIFRKFKIEGQDFALLSALLLGRKEYLEKEVTQEFSHAGVIHVLCVSGLHVGIMYIVADKLFFFLKRNRKSRKVHQIIILGFIWAYAFIAGLPLSVIRAALMFSLIASCRLFKRSSESYNIVAVAAFIQLLINPYDITQVGFQLSYIAVLGIFAFYKPFNETIGSANFIAAGVWSVLAVSLAAQLATFPLACHYFKLFPVYFLLTNLLVVPLAGVITYFAVFLLAVGASGMAFEWLAWPLKWSLRLMSGSVEFIQSLPGAVIEPIILSPVQVILIYAAIVGLFIFWVMAYRKGVLIIIGSLLILTFISTYSIYRKLKTTEIIIYQVSGHTAIDLVHQQHTIFICDSLLMADPPTIAFQVQPNRIGLGISDVRVMTAEKPALLSSVDTWIRYPFLFFRGKTILVINNQWNSKRQELISHCDLAVFSGNPRINPGELKKQVDLKQVIIDSSVPMYRAEELTQLFKTEGIPCHSVRHDGAFVLRW